MMPILSKLRTQAVIPIVLLSTLVVCCRAQTSEVVTPELAHRIEAMLRSRTDFPPATSFTYGRRLESEIAGYDRIEVHYSTLGGSSGEIPLLISKDGATLAQFSKFDISVDPRTKFQADDRPSRGGPADAPVLIVGYDDLECPFCARLHAELFPALLERYKNEVRIVYRSFPSEGHPWAMHAAIDTDCLGAESVPAYWAAVDNIHARAAEYGGAEHSLVQAKIEIDVEVRKQGHAFQVNEEKLNACILRQDQTAENASLNQGMKLGVDSTPTLFINGVKIKGAESLSFIFAAIDDALRAEGKTPPPYSPSKIQSAQK
jgi:protein-disulfide isomerase